MSEDTERISEGVSAVTSNNAPSFMPFGFLDLPGELRNEVYERLPRSIHPRTFRFEKEFRGNSHLDYEMTVILGHMDASMLQTCKQIHYEAKKKFREIAASFILSSPIRLIVPAWPSLGW
jgi:hypothetical protein